MQSAYYDLQFHKICRNLKRKYQLTYDSNTILFDTIFARLPVPADRIPAYKSADGFLERPSYRFFNVYHALEVLGAECRFIQSEAYQNSLPLCSDNNNVLYCNCFEYFPETQVDDNGGKSKKNEKISVPSPIRLELLMKAGIPLAFSLFSESGTSLTSFHPHEALDADKRAKSKNCPLIYCSDSESVFHGMPHSYSAKKNACIAIRSIEELPSQYKTWALYKRGFRRVRDNKPADDWASYENDTELYYKRKKYIIDNAPLRLIIVYSPKYALYRKDPSSRNGLCNGLYAVITDLTRTGINEIIRITEERWQLAEYSMTMKTEFGANLLYPQSMNRIKAHFLICFLALLTWRQLEQKLDRRYTFEEIKDTLSSMNFAAIQGQGFIPLYRRNEITDMLHDACGFRTDYQFLTKSQMKTVMKRSKGRK